MKLDRQILSHLFTGVDIDLFYYCCIYHCYLLFMKQNLYIHPRRPRGSQSGAGEISRKSFQERAKKPLGTKSYRTISKRLHDCRLLIGHKKILCIIVPNRRTATLESLSCVLTRRLLSRLTCPARSPRLCLRVKLSF